MTTVAETARAAFEHFCVEHCAAPASVHHAGRDFVVIKSAVHELDVFVLLMNATERVAIRFDAALPTPTAIGARVTLRAGLHLVPHPASLPTARYARRNRLWSWLGWLYRRSSMASCARPRPRTPYAHADS